METLFAAMDVASFVLALLVSAFFWRSYRHVEDSRLALVAIGFAIISVAYLAVATSHHADMPRLAVVEALRVAGAFLGALVLLLGYAARRAGLRPRTGLSIALGAGIVGFAYVALYLSPYAGGLPSPLEQLPPFRLVETLVFLGIAGLATVEVRPRLLHELRVPLAFVCLALSRYTVAVLSIEGGDLDSLLVYFWRCAGLLLLLSVVLRRWPAAPA